MIRKSALIFGSSFFVMWSALADTAGASHSRPVVSIQHAWANSDLYSSDNTSPYDFDIQFGGLFQADTMYFGGAPQLQGNGNWREGRPYVQIQLTKTLSFLLVYDLVNETVYNLFFTYQPTQHVVFTGGQYSPIWGIANSDDTSALNFLELPLPYQPFSPTEGLGGQVQFLYDPWGFTVSEYGPRIQYSPPSPEPITETVNIIYSPLHTETKVFAVVLAAWQQPTDGSNLFDFSAIPEIDAHNNGTLIDTGDITAKNFWVGSSGITWQNGPISATGEYEHDYVNRANSLGNLNFDGYYLDASYFLTGESRTFNFGYSGYVGISKVRHSYGAWQLSTQFSYLNLGDRDVQGGEEKNASLGLNWYPVNHVKYQFVYIRSWATPNSDGYNQTSNFFGFRMQLVF